MLTTILILTCFILGAVYPLCFWILRGISIKENFERFNLGMANFFAGLGVFLLFFVNINNDLKIASILWFLAMLFCTAVFWRQEKINVVFLSIPSIFGIYLTGLLQAQIAGSTLTAICASILGGFVLSLSLFTMILGHWYLNVPGLPLKHLLDSTYSFLIVLLARFIWDLFFIFRKKILYFGDWVYIYQFIGHIDGIFLLMALFFGTALPAFLIYYVLGTLKVKSTQSATGILYVIVIAVLMGDFSYKYYLIKFGLPL